MRNTNHRWRVRDLLVAAHVSVVYGMLFLLWNLAFVTLRPWLKLLFAVVGWGPVGSEWLMGFWFGAGVLVPYLVRKPGAAFLGEVVASMVQVAATPWGLLTVLSGIIQGAMSESVFAATRYRRWNTPVFLLAGALPALASFAFEYPLYNVGRYAWRVQVAMLLARLISGAVLGGWVPIQLGRAVLASRVIDWRDA